MNELPTAPHTCPGSYNASLFTDNTTVNTTTGKQRSEGSGYLEKKGYHWVIDQFVDSQKLIGHRFDLFPLKLAHQVMKNIWIHLFIRISTKI